ELPEYSEEDALADMVSEPGEPTQPQVEEVQPEQAAEDSVALNDLELPEYSEEDALADMASESSEPTQPEAEEVTSEQAAEESVELDDLELPEYSEEDALADMVSEPGEPTQPQVEEVQPELVAEDSVAFDDLELPEYSEEDALADMVSEPSETTQPQAEVAESELTAEELVEFDDLELPEYSEEDALDELSTQPHAESAESSHDPVAAHQDYDEQAFDELLTEDDSQAKSFSFDQPIDAKTSDSAGMDIDAMLEMGGEDWNGFTLSPEQQAQISDDIPEEDQAIWSQENQPAKATVQEENWEDQHSLDDFNPKENQFRTIDELMAEVEGDEDYFIDEALKLDVGLNDFPDVIGDIGEEEDIDANAEAAGKLDLAKIYMEMNDTVGARKLLEEAIVDGNEDIRREAKSLIDGISQS
ncbi:MAG: AAA family ATPase, partial [Vibrionaceae bacterium]|nr:AAA family ATPase [Vibrionaceae bacterium]